MYKLFKMTTNRRYEEQVLLFKFTLPEKSTPYLPKYNMAPLENLQFFFAKRLRRMSLTL